MMHRKNREENMMRRKLVVIAGVFALLVNAVAMGSDSPNDDLWTVEFIPYVWAATLQGDTGGEGVESPVNPDYSFFALENLHGAFMGSMRLSRGHWSWSADTLHVDYQDDFSGRLVDTHVGVSGGFVEIAAGYRPDENGNLEWLGGLRDVSFGTEIEFTPGPAGRADKSWLDPFIGLRYRYPLSDHWAIQLRGDMGGFHPCARLSMNGMIAMEYSVSDKFQLIAGYRHLELDFRKDEFLLDLSARGFGIGAILRY
jgi:hypothetical protein